MMAVRSWCGGGLAVARSIGVVGLIAAVGLGCAGRQEEPQPDRPDPARPGQTVTSSIAEISPPIELVLITAGPDVRRAFYIGKFEITNAQYAAFVRETGYDGSDHPSSKPTEQFLDYWTDGRYPPDLRDHPVTRINWHHAKAFCDWLARKTGRVVRLPTDAEWEWAARGRAGRVYPWGDEWDPRRCNWGDPGEIDGYAETAPVGSFPAGATPEGVHDLAGNIWEWSANKVLRGGPWCLDAESVRCEWKGREDPQRADDKFGFRVVVEVEWQESSGR